MPITSGVGKYLLEYLWLQWSHLDTSRYLYMKQYLDLLSILYLMYLTMNYFIELVLTHVLQSPEPPLIVIITAFIICYRAGPPDTHIYIYIYIQNTL